jgi:ABC-type Fe3+-hydroxamate transport system substrate-binding protein
MSDSSILRKSGQSRKGPFPLTRPCTGYFVNRPKGYRETKRVRNKVEEFPLARDFSDLCNNFLRLGRLLGKEKEASGIVMRAKEEIISIRKSIKDLPQKKVFIQVGSKPLFTMTGDNFVNHLIELAGGVNIAKDSKTGLWSREMVVKIDPDVILITTMGVDAEAEIKEWSRFRGLKAVRHRRIYVIDSYKIGSPTPLSFVEALKESRKDIA